MIVLKASPIFQHTKEILSQWAHLLERRPTLGVIFVGESPASELYIEKKRVMAESLGFGFRLQRYPADSHQEVLLAAIKKLNHDPHIDGILIQLPLPAHLNAQELLLAINPDKDVDGLHPVNQGLLWANAPYQRYFAPCTPLGIVRMLRWYHIELAGKNVLILGRSQLVGRPLAAMLLHSNAQVTIAHKAAPVSQDIVKNANIIVVATGTREALSWDQIAPHHIVVDVGTHKIEGGGSCGDLGPRPEEFILKGYSPVPGGVGPMTVNSLMYNIFKSHCLRSAPQVWAEFTATHRTLFEPLS